MKVAGRDAGKYCVIIGKEDDKVLVEGQTRRRAINPTHVEPLAKEVDVSEGASYEDVKKALTGIGIEVVDPVKQKDIVKSKQK